MSFKHQWEDKGVIVTYDGELTSDDIIKSNSALVGNARYEKIKYILSDFNHISEVNVSDTDVEITKLFATKAYQYNKNIKVALISSNPALQILIENYINKTLEEIPSAQQKLFSTLSEARLWLAS